MQQLHSILSRTLMFATVLMLLTSVVEAKSTKQGNASDLISSAQHTVGVVVRTAKKDPALKIDKSKAKPFWDATKDLNTNLAKAETGLTLKDNTFFSSLASATAAFAQAKVGIDMSGSSNKQLNAAMGKLSGILDTLNRKYSKEAARLKKGGKLTDAEKKKLKKLIAQQDVLMSKLDKVEKNASSNKAKIKKGIKKIRASSNKIKGSRYTVEGFVSGFAAAHITYDLLWGWHWWWGPWGGWAPSFIEHNVIIWDDWIDHYDYDWDLIEDYVDVADLELDAIDIDDAELDASDAYLDEGDFGLADGDLEGMTSDIDQGWDDVSTEKGAEIMEGVESNFDNSAIYEREEPIDTFEGRGMDDFGGDFGGGDFDGGDF
jgi:hypothetical protein